MRGEVGKEGERRWGRREVGKEGRLTMERFHTPPSHSQHLSRCIRKRNPRNSSVRGHTIFKESPSPC